MCVLQCTCGMFVSTSGKQARCIRCGAILGARNEMRMVSSRISTVTVEVRTNEVTTFNQAPPLEREASVRRVSLWVVAEMKRGEGRQRAGSVRWLRRLAAMWPVVTPKQVMLGK